MFGNLAILALIFGLISAVSMPLGALTLKLWLPKDKIVAFMLAFGSGALLAALTLDLVGESVENGFFFQLASGCIMGSLLFIGLNYMINRSGGFLRKSSTTMHYMKMKKTKQYKYLFEKLSNVNLFQQLPPEEVHAILPFIINKDFADGQILFKKGEPGDSMYIIEEGEIQIINPDTKKIIAKLSENTVLGEMALVTGEPRSASAVAVGHVKLWMILKEHFDEYLYKNPKISSILEQMVSERISDLKDKESIDHEIAHKWIQKATRNMQSSILTPTDAEIREEAKAHSSAGIAIWLGNLLDCIPGSLVIGTSLTSSSISISLIAGLFLANYPEALSSSFEMQKQGSSFKKVLLMWTSLMIITGLGALLGNMFLTDLSHGSFAIIEGIAAGAMLTMIAETMLPEAYHKYSTITGFSTLLGFLIAIFLKTFE